MRTLNRRAFFAVCGTGAAASLPLSAQRVQHEPIPQYPVPRASSAVLEGLREVSVRVSNHVAAGQRSAGDVRMLASSLNVFFHHLDEIGAIDPLERYLQSRGLPTLSNDDFDAARILAEQQGVYMSDSDFGNLRAQQANAPLVAQYIRENGLRKYHAGLVSLVYDTATEIDGMADYGEYSKFHFVPAGQHATPYSVPRGTYHYHLYRDVSTGTIRWGCVSNSLVGFTLMVWKTAIYAGALPELGAVMAAAPGVMVAAGVAIGLYGMYCMLSGM